MRSKQTITALGLNEFIKGNEHGFYAFSFAINITVLCNITINYYNFYQFTWKIKEITCF